jgi:hypothetical protein
MRRDYTALAFAAAILISPALTRPARAVPQIVVEAKCSAGPAYVEGGTGWTNSNAKSNKTPCSAGSRSSRDAAAYADFIPAIVTEGRYDVYATWGQTTSNNNGPNAENVQVSIIDRDGTHTGSVNMRGYSGCAGANGDQLILIGSGYFVPGQAHKVRISNTASGQCQFGASKRYVSADAVVFEYAELTPTRPVSWGKVKIIYRD